MRPTWDQHFMDMAVLAAIMSKDPSTQVGAVLVKDRRILGTGFNGFPPQIEDRPEWYDDREIKYSLTIHAEHNAILNATRSAVGGTLYVTHPPCGECAKYIAAAGLVRVVYRRVAPEFEERWAKSLAAATRVFRLAGIHLVAL